MEPLIFKDATTEVPYEKSVLMYKENNKYGIIDFKGKKITNAIYDSIESLLYKEGCLLVKKEDKYGVINIRGKQMVEIKYDSITADGYYDESTKYQKAGFIVGNKTADGYKYRAAEHKPAVAQSLKNREANKKINISNLI